MGGGGVFSIKGTPFIEMIIAHEMLHALGFTQEILKAKNCYQNVAGDPTTCDSNEIVYYGCVNAVTQYQQYAQCLQKTSSSYSFPVPNRMLIHTTTGNLGSDCGHWDEAIYKREIMTPVSSNLWHELTLNPS